MTEERIKVDVFQNYWCITDDTDIVKIVYQYNHVILRYGLV